MPTLGAAVPYQELRLLMTVYTLLNKNVTEIQQCPLSVIVDAAEKLSSLVHSNFPQHIYHEMIWVFLMKKKEH